MTLEQEIAKRRTFGIISHPDAGKTTLTEKLLLFGGAIQKAGAVKSSKIYPNKREIPDESNKKRKTTKAKYLIDNEEGFDEEESSSKQNDDAIYTSKVKLNRL